MTQPAFGEVRPAEINPVLSGLSIGFKNPRFYWDLLAPYQSVDQQSGTYFKYDREYWFRHQSGGDRAPASPYTRVGYGLSVASYACYEIGYEKALDEVIRAASLYPMDLVTSDISFLTNQIQMEIERRAVDALFNKDGVWSVDKVKAADVRWDDAAVNPIKDIREGSNRIKRTTGARPNTLFMGSDVWDALQMNPTLVGMYHYNTAGLITMAQLQEAFDIPNIYVGDNSYTTGEEGQDDDDTNYTDFYKSHALLLCREVPGLSVANGATSFIWDEAGNVPWAAQDYFENNIRSIINRVFSHFDFKVVSDSHGYRFKNIVGA